MLSIIAGKRVVLTVMLAALATGAVMAQQQGPAGGKSRLGTPSAAGQAS